MKLLSRSLLSLGIAVILLLLPALTAAADSSMEQCRPTRPDVIGPFYRPDAPVRSKVGSGYRLTGVVRSAATCEPVPQAKIELWQTGPDGAYDDRHRAVIYADAEGRYAFETDFPAPYSGRPPHIHIMVNAPHFDRLITQHYPQKGEKAAVFDLVLTPAGE